MNFNLAYFEDFLSLLKKLLPSFFILLVVVEFFYLFVFVKNYSKKETAINLFTGGISVVIQSILKIYFFTNLYPYVYEHRLFNIQLGWHQVIITLLMYGFLQFFIHVVAHKVRFFWCLHEVHHSATHMNVTTGLRTSIFDQVSLEMLYLLIPFLGFHYVFYFLFYSINKFWGSFIHINEKLVSEIPWLKYILVTPAGHHIHHASNIPYLDKNYGELVPWFDFIFKTYKKQDEGAITYGTLKVTKEIGFWEAQTHEFKHLWQDVNNTSNYWHKLGYIFMPPGWQPGNNAFTASALQRNYYQ
jgi:sterol desaturase/sphingolipid hydroxylase (fatty acid hydroxylase superfamily)